ncbi:MAG: penicillin-binding protein 2 [Brevinematales bacterium]|nr:penicillin-binding protein 2 [Brevinematales bacterium]
MIDFRIVESNIGISRFRLIIFSSLVMLVFSIVFIRVIDMQVLSRDKFVKLAYINMAQQIPITAHRGTIYDRNFVQIAWVQETIGVFVIQKYLPQSEEGKMMVFSKLSGIIDKSTKFIIGNIERRKWDIYGPIFISEITKEQAVKILERQEELPGVVVDTVYQRYYRYPYETAHILGYLGPIDQQELKSLSTEDKEIYHSGSYIGKDGIEKQYDKVLRGVDGKLLRYIDSKNNIVGMEIERLPVEGNSIVLSIDTEIQNLGYDLLKSYRGSLVMMKPSTGEIIALVSSPSYDPNKLSTGDFAYFLSLSTDEKNTPLFNRAIQGTYQPGSVFKLVTTASAIISSKWDPSRTESCQGALRIGRRVFNDWAIHGYVKDIIKAIEVSCDVYFYKVAMSISPNDLIETARLFGLGELTFIDLPNEKKGFRTSIDFHRKKYNRDIMGGDMANLSIGQGDWLMTPLQLAVLGSFIFNEGVVYKPFIVKKILSPDGREVVKEMKPEILRKDFSIPKEVFRLLKQGMKQVFEEGTARGLKFITKYHIAGKTGTAENPHGKPHSVFVAYGPTDAQNPDDVVVVAVVVENVGSGSAYAGPIAAKLIDTYFDKYGYTKKQSQ